LKPGDVVVGAFPGADATKVRPAVVLSTELYELPPRRAGLAPFHPGVRILTHRGEAEDEEGRPGQPLGLKLQAQKRPVPVVVIDHLEQKPVE
jgi:hypothetical protein